MIVCQFVLLKHQLDFEYFFKDDINVLPLIYCIYHNILSGPDTIQARVSNIEIGGEVIDKYMYSLVI